jgi:hypothetical protein
VDIRTAIDRLDHDIQQLKIDFERFFNGGLPMPPEEFRQAVRGQIRTLRTKPIHALVDRFRINTLEARFNTLNELFNRRLRDREEGVATRAAATPTARRYDPYQGIVVGASPPSEAIQALYEELYRSDKPAPPANFNRFESYLLRQMAEIRDRTGCTEVKFRVASEGGKLKLKAKPVRQVRLPATGGLHGG